MDKINAQAKMIDGKEQVPTMFGDQGWYAWKPEKYSRNARQLWYLSMKEADRARLADDSWVSFLEGKNPSYPETALRRELEQVRLRVDGMRKDTTTPDTRLADDPLPFGPANVNTLVEQMLGGLPAGKVGSILHSRLRYFDPVRRRAGLPEDVAALVDRLTADEVAVTLVNVNQLEERTLVVQAGAYGEHRFTGLLLDGKKVTPG